MTAQSQIKELYRNTYKNRLKHRDMKPEFETLYKMKMFLFDIRFKVCKYIKSENWPMEDLLKVLKKLKKNKSADSHGLIYELLRPEVIGEDLLKSLLMICNQVKTQLTLPEFIT